MSARAAPHTPAPRAFTQLTGCVLALLAAAPAAAPAQERQTQGTPAQHSPAQDTPAQDSPAQPAGFAADPAVVFAAHAGRVQTPAPGVQHLELPGPVILTARTYGGRTSYTAEDQSGKGAVLCQLDTLVRAAILEGRCTLLDAPARVRLNRLLNAYARFAAQNTLPPVPKDQIGPRIRALIARHEAALGLSSGGNLAATCPAPGAGDRAADMLRAITTRAATRRALARLRKPRLPVHSPCN